MAYYVFIGPEMMPIPPDSIQTKINNQNKTITLINQGEVNIIKKAGLTDIEFELLLPNVKYPFATYKQGFVNAKHFLDYFEWLKINKVAVQFIVSRQFPDGRVLYSTNITVTLEEYSFEDTVDEGFDIRCSVNLKQYVPFETITCSVTTNKKKKKKKKKKKSRKGKKKKANSKNKKYKVKKGDTSSKIAKKFYGSSSKWRLIYNANKKVFKGRGPNKVKVGDVLTIPPAS